MRWAAKARRNNETFRALRLFVGAVPLVLLTVVVRYLWSGWRELPPDAFTYLAAGERLNVGHSLYGLLGGAGDRPLIDAALYPAPILSPPLIAVIWRPLAALGPGTVYLWWSRRRRPSSRPS